MGENVLTEWIRPLSPSDFCTLRGECGGGDGRESPGGALGDSRFPWIEHVRHGVGGFWFQKVVDYS